MEIYNGYTTGDALFDLPFKNNTLTLYPVKVKNYKEFEKYIKYFMFSKKHYKLDNKSNLFEYVIAVGISTQSNSKANKNKNISKQECLDMVIKDFEVVFSIICREKISLDMISFQTENEIKFVNEDKTIKITSKNFELVRKIVLKQNAIKEPKIFEDEIEERLAEKFLKAQSKRNKGNLINELGEIANLVSCVTGKSYEQLYNQNILQLYSDYFRCISIEMYKSNMMFMTVSDKIKPNDYTESVIPKLFEDIYEKMWIDRDSVGFLN